MTMQENKDQNMNKENNQSQGATNILPNIKLLHDALKAMGCEPKIENESTLGVQYQGENFHMECSGDYCRIWDPYWSSVNVDTPEYPLLVEAINDANWGFGPTVVMTDANEEGMVYIHSRYDILFGEACLTSFPDFLKESLGSFFHAKYRVNTKYNELKSQLTTSGNADRPLPGRQHIPVQKARRPIGFATGTADDADPAAPTE